MQMTMERVQRGALVCGSALHVLAASRVLDGEREGVAARWLEAAVRAAEDDVPHAPVASPVHWAWRVVGFYHLAHQTPRLLERAAAGLAASGRHELARWATARAHAETDRDRLALADLAELGYDAERLVGAVIPAATARLLAMFGDAAASADPIRCVGYTYALDRLAATSRDDELRLVRAMLPPFIQANRCRRAGAEVEHANEAVRVVAHAAAHELDAIARAAYELASVALAPPFGGHPTNVQVMDLLRGT